MKSIFFPYTGISGKVADNLKSFVGRISIYKLLTEVPGGLNTGDDAFIACEYPLKDQEDRLKVFLQEYRNWASGFNGRGSEYLKGGGSVPFFDPGWASQLRTELTKRLDQEDSGGIQSSIVNDDALLMAGAYLQLAEEYDRQSEDIRQQFTTCVAKEKTLLDCLHGSEGAAPEEQDLPLTLPVTDDEDVFQLETRIVAWAEMFDYDIYRNDVSGDLCFITDSTAVMDYLREHFSGIECVGIYNSAESGIVDIENRVSDICRSDFQPGEVWQEERMSQENIPCLKLFVIPQTTPQECFGQFLKRTPIAEPDATIRNTVVGLISRE